MNTNQAEKNKLNTIVIKGSNTIITNAYLSENVFTNLEKTIPFTNWGQVQKKPVTLYVN